MEYVLTGEYGGLTSLPDYLKPENFAVLKDLIDRVHFIQGELLKHMEAAAMEGLHVADLSNIFDFVPEDLHNHYRTAVMRHMSPGSRICHWTFVPMTSPKLAQINIPFSPKAHIEPEECERYNSQERAWFYQTFVLQCVQKEGYKKNGYINAAKLTNGVKHRISAAGDKTVTGVLSDHTKVKELDTFVCNGIQ